MDLPAIEHFSKFGKLKSDTWEIGLETGKYIESQEFVLSRLRRCQYVRVWNDKTNLHFSEIGLH